MTRNERRRKEEALEKLALATEKAVELHKGTTRLLLTVMEIEDALRGDKQEEELPPNVIKFRK